ALEPSPQTAFDGPHFSVVGFVIVSHQMQQSMKNEAPDIRFETKRAGFAGLIICGFRGDENIAQVSRFAAERQHVGGLVEAAIGPVVLAHLLVGDQYNGKRAGFNTKLVYERRKEPAQLRSADGMLSLLVDDELVAIPRWHPTGRTGAVAAARGSARC